MPNQFIEDLLNMPFPAELSRTHWNALLKQELETTDLKKLSKHTGIERHILSDALIQEILSEESLSMLQQIEQKTTQSIINFQNTHPNLNEFNIKALELSRAQWNTLISMFEHQRMQHVTKRFLLESLPTVLNLRYEELIDKLKRLGYSDTHTLRPKRPQADESNQIKRARLHPLKNHGPLPIVDENELVQLEGSDLLSEELGEIARITQLQQSLTTPIKATQNNHKKTPGGTRVKPLFKMAGLTLFTAASPEKRISPNKADTDLNIQRATAVTFTVTEKSIKSREKVKRISAKQIMGAPAHRLFDIVGLKESSQETQNFHWAHVAAHSFVDPVDIHPASSEEEEEDISNLVPSTAAANYNTLLLENLIRNKLFIHATDEIKVTVTPVYNEDIPIPSLLIYKLKWAEKGEVMKQVYHIYPQSPRSICIEEYRVVRWLQQRTSTSDKESERDMASDPSTEMDTSSEQSSDEMDISYTKHRP